MNHEPKTEEKRKAKGKVEIRDLMPKKDPKDGLAITPHEFGIRYLMPAQEQRRS